jgi:hypothetical protein
MSEEQTNAAWDFFKKGEPDPVQKLPARRENLRRSIEITDSVITDLKGPADTKEQSLIHDAVPLPSTGDVTAQERRAIFAYGALNDVATCLWIKGRAFQHLGSSNDAVRAYLQITNYPHARTWDPKGWFWSPYDDALGRLNALTNAIK